MIRYRDYSGPQRNCAVINGKVVPFDNEAARKMAEHAHFLAIGAEYAAEQHARAEDALTTA
jgi:hypothetical protein